MNVTDALNITDIIQLTPEKFITAANTHVLTPLLVIFFILYSFIMLASGLIFVKEDTKKFWGIWLFAVVFGLLLLVFMIAVPEFFIDISTKLSEFMN